jgi:hypothetical protein
MFSITRRRFVQYAVAAGAALALPSAVGSSAASVATSPPLRRFLEPLPVPGAGMVVATPSGPNHYSFTQRKIARKLHPDLPPTSVWPYDDGSGLAGQAGSLGWHSSPRAARQSG